MKLARGHLTTALTTVNLAIERRNTIPILGYAAIAPSESGARIMGTDLDLQITCEVEASDWSGEAFTLPAPHTITGMLAIGGEDVEINPSTIDKEQKRIAIRSGHLDITVRDLPFGDFPMMHRAAPAASVQLSTEHIDTILRVARACSTEETRYYLNGVYIHREDDWTLRAVATDGHRLYRAPLAVPDGEAFGRALPGQDSHGGIIIPRKAIKLLSQLRGRMGDTIAMEIGSRAMENENKTLAPSGGTLLAFTFDNRGLKTTIATKLIDGTFPDYSRVIPSGNDKAIEIDRCGLMRALLALSLGRSKTPPIKLTFDPAGRLKISRQFGEEIDGASFWIEARTSISEPFEIGFNGRYLADICQVTGGDHMVINCADAGAPTNIEAPESEGFRAVLMPMRV